MSLVGKYQLIRELATGGMAKVYLARAAGPKGFTKTLVLKSILPSLTEDPQFVEMFLTEARLAALLNHPNIVQIYELGEVGGTYFIAMEYVDGPNLRTLRKRARELGRQLPLPVIAKIVSHACEGLAYAHGFADPETSLPLGLVHRDVSPDNILVSRTGVVKLVDFGIAKAAGGEHTAHLTKPGSLKGKLAYMPPEQVRGESLDARADIYALGVLLYELITGVRPHKLGTSGTSTSDAQIMHAILFEPFVPVKERRQDVPEVLQRILERCMAKDRDERYADCHELQMDLESYIAMTGESVGMQRLAQVVNELVGPPEPVDARTSATLGSQSRSLSQPVSTPSRSPSQPVSTPSRSLGATVPTPVPVVAGAPLPAAARRPPPPLPAKPVQAAGGGRSWAVPAAAAALLVAGGGFVAFRTWGPSQTSVPTAAPAPVPAEAQPAAQAAAPAPRAEALAAVAAPQAPAPQAESPVEAPAEAPAPAASAEEEAQPQAERRSAPRLASLAVESNVPAQVRLNGRAVGSTPLKLRGLTPGRVRLEVVNPGMGVRKEETVRLQAGDNGVQRFSFAQGTLEFRIRPYANVILDGKLLGQTPLKVTTFEGPHEIILVNRDLGKEVKLTHVVKADQLNVVKYVLDE